MEETPTPMVSVVVPTYHRPDLLRRTVASVLGQTLRNGTSMEVIVSVSDATSAEDRRAADELADGDPRVRVALADRPGPAAARNAGIRVASGDIVAFIDDDCVAQPGWLAAGVRAMREHDIVQGRTMPPIPEPPLYSHTLWIQEKTFLWETCNLFVRREAIARGGLFDEAYNPTGRVGGHWGEDAEWGWRLVRAGARDGFEADAYVHHEVLPRDYWGYLKYRSRIRYFPLLFRTTPEARGTFYRGVFLNRRHAALVGAAALAASAAALRAAGAGTGSRVAVLGAGALYLSPLRHSVGAGRIDLSGFHPREMLREAVELASLAYGTLRWRRVLL